MGRQDIHAVIKAWVEVHNWPTHAGIRLGPATCGIGRCRKKHAYARSGLSDHDKIPIIYWYGYNLTHYGFALSAPIGAAMSHGLS